MTDEVRFRIIVEDPGVAAAHARAEAGFQRVGAAAAGAGRQTTAAMRMLPAQLSDVATQLAGGQSPFLVLLQQGLQTRDMFGSFREAGRGVLSVLTPMRVGIGALVGSLGALAFAAYSGREGAMALTRAIELNGQAGARTVGQIDQMARTLAGPGTTSIGNARDVMLSLASSGAFVGENMQLAGRAVVSLQRLSGQSAQQIVQQFAGIRDGVTAWSVAANRSYNFLTAAQVEQIRTLESQGRTQDAIRVSMDALASAMDQRVTPAMGTLERAIQGAKNAWSGFWDAAKSIGRPDTLEEQLDLVRRQIAFLRTTPDVRGVRELRQQEAYLQEQLRLEQRGAESRAAAAADNAREIARQQASFVDAELSLEAARQAKLLAEENRGIEARRLALDLSFQQRTISAAKYTQNLIALERQRTNAEVAAAQAAVNREQRRVADKPEDVLARDRAVLQAQTALVAKLAERDKLEARIRAGELRAADYAVGGESLVSLFRQSELQAAAGVDQALDERRRAAASAAVELTDTNRALNIELLQDDRQRAVAQLAMETESMRRRLQIEQAYADERAALLRLGGRQYGATINGQTMVADIAQQTDEEAQALVASAESAANRRRELEEQLAQWRLGREKQLNEQLKPEWQRLLDGWADTTKNMQRRYDDFLTSFISGGRDAFAQWAAEGRITTSGLASFIRAEFAKLLYERYLAGYVRSIGESLFNIVTGSSGGGSGMPDDVPTRGGRAGGGQVAAGSAYWVGERGPEVLLMGQRPGFVVPNVALAGAGGGGTVLHQHFNLRGNEDSATLYALANMAGDRAVARVADMRRRGAPGF